MDFSLSTEQRELKKAAAAFARATLNRDLAEREESGEFPRAAWQACARFGVTGTSYSGTSATQRAASSRMLGL